MTQEAFDRLSTLTEGFDRQITISLSLLCSLLDNCDIPVSNKEVIINLIEEKILREDKE